MTMASAKFQKWLLKEVTDIAEKGGIERFELYHTVSGMGAEKVQEFPYDGEDSEEFAQTIWDKAEEDAETRTVSMPQRYTVLSFLPDVSEQRGTFSFVLTHRGIGEGVFGESTDPPNERGVIGSQMRHTEVLMKTLVGMIDTVWARQARDNDLLYQRAAKAESVLMENFKLQQELMDRKAERDLSIAKETLKEKQAAQFFDTLTSLAPAVLASLAPPGSPLQMQGAESSVFTFLKGLGEDEVMGILGALKPHNQAAVLEIYRMAKQKDKASQESLPEALRDKKN